MIEKNGVRESYVVVEWNGEDKWIPIYEDSAHATVKEAQEARDLYYYKKLDPRCRTPENVIIAVIRIDLSEVE